MYADNKDLLEAVVMSLVAIFVLAWAIGTIQTRQRIQQARARGVWPPLGQIPTDEDLKRLVKAGEKLLAIKMCRQIHNMGFTEAKAVVERLAEQADAGAIGDATRISGEYGKRPQPPSKPVKAEQHGPPNAGSAGAPPA